jgi:hypothetical protein
LALGNILEYTGSENLPTPEVSAALRLDRKMMMARMLSAQAQDNMTSQVFQRTL